MKVKCPKGCAVCCDMNVFVVMEDLNRWLDEDRTDIIACLTWYKLRGSMPEEMLFIPKKMHIVGHSFLGRFYRREWSNDKSCIFLHGKCAIYKTRPKTCRDFPRGNIGNPCPGMTGMTPDDAERAEELHKEAVMGRIILFNERGTFTRMVRRAKLDADTTRLARILGLEDGKDEKATQEDDK